jgi:hypothetical protein
MAVPSIAEFLRRVLPWPGDEPGYCNLHYSMVKRQGMAGLPFQKLADFEKAVQWANTHPGMAKDVYFCLGRQKDIGKVINGRAYALRNHLNTVALKAIWLDLDVKEKGYASVTEALQAIKAFCASENLPPPTALVGSGGGVHCYWISSKELPVEGWTLFAEGLRTAATHFGLRFDAGVTIDCARILRVPGTYNKKEQIPREVKLLLLAPQDIDFEKAFAGTKAIPGQQRVDAGTQAKHRLCLLPQQTGSPDLLTAEYQKEIGTVQEELLDPRPAFTQCPFFRAALLTGGKHHDQGLWMLTALATTFVRKGRELFHTLSKGHADYSPASADAMYDRKEAEQQDKKLGWPSCQTFESYGSKQCKDCPLKGTIRSPLNLLPRIGGGTPGPSSLAVAGIASVPESGRGQPSNDLSLPLGYSTNNAGRIVKTRTAAVPIDIPLFHCVITDPWTQKNKGLNFTASTDKGSTVEVLVESKDLASAAMLGGSLSKQFVLYSPGTTKLLMEFMVAWMDKFNSMKAARDTVAYGWYREADHDMGWAYGGIINKKDGTTMKSSSGDPAIRDLYTPQGDIETWFKALKLVTDQHRPAIEVIAAAAFASPLLHFTGHYSGALVAYSQSGGNKSTALNVGAAVWGNPKLTKEVASSSQNSMRGKMAELNNLPCYWDDVSLPKAIEKAAEVLVDITQGKDGGKMNVDRSQKVVGSWQSLLTICSNVSLFDYMVDHQQSNAAGIYRTFEFLVPKADDNTPGRVEEWSATILQQQLETNYGRMGERYSKVMLSNPEAMQEFVTDTQKKLASEVAYKPDERFWLAIATTILAGARLANTIGASFNTEEIHVFLVDAYKAMRDRVVSEDLIGDSEENIMAALTHFLKDMAGNTIRTRDMVRGAGGRSKQVGFVGGPEHTNVPIHVQFVLDEHLLRISRKQFIEHMHRTKHSPSMVMAGLRTFYKMRDGRANLAAGTLFQGGQERLLEIPVPQDSWLDETAQAYTPMAEIKKRNDAERLKVIRPDQ